MNIPRLIPALLALMPLMARHTVGIADEYPAADNWSAVDMGQVSVGSQSAAVSMLDEVGIGELPLATPEGVMPLDEYVFGVLLGELPYTFDTDTFAAQAVAARSYCLYCIDHNQQIQCAYDTPDSLAANYGDEYARASVDAARRAVESTAGVLAIYDGEPISALWHSSSHGRTENSVNVWGGEYDYLVSVETYEEGGFLESTAEFSLDDVYSRLYDAGYDYNMKERVWMTYDDCGRCERLMVGNVSLSGCEARTIFGLKSTDFTVRFDSGRLIFNVYGYGHGVGMSQYGAEWLAEAGWDWQSILLHYYPGCEIIKW